MVYDDIRLTSSVTPKLQQLQRPFCLLERRAQVTMVCLIVYNLVDIPSAI